MLCDAWEACGCTEVKSRARSGVCHMGAPEVVGTEGWGEGLPDEAPPVICLGGEQIGLLPLVSELHRTPTSVRLWLHAVLRSCLRTAKC